MMPDCDAGVLVSFCVHVVEKTVVRDGSFSDLVSLSGGKLLYKMLDFERGPQNEDGFGAIQCGKPAQQGRALFVTKMPNPLKKLQLEPLGASLG